MGRTGSRGPAGRLRQWQEERPHRLREGTRGQLVRACPGTLAGRWGPGKQSPGQPEPGPRRTAHVCLCVLQGPATKHRRPRGTGSAGGDARTRARCGSVAAGCHREGG